jgi:cation transport protein ChaC
MPLGDKTFWVFGYGSLLWNPGFRVAQSKIARLHGWRRSFCMSSIHHRGTVENPGLVLALDRAQGAECQGVAFRVDAGDAPDTLAYLRERELVSSAYLETVQQVVMDDNGDTQPALTYVIDPRHDQYRGDLPLQTQAEIIARATGGRGPNDEYLFNTAKHLENLGLADADLQWLVARVQAIQSA